MLRRWATVLRFSPLGEGVRDGGATAGSQLRDRDRLGRSLLVFVIGYVWLQGISQALSVAAPAGCESGSPVRIRVGRDRPMPTKCRGSSPGGMPTPVRTTAVSR